MSDETPRHERGMECAQVLRLHGADAAPAQDRLCQEVPIALEFNGVSHAVMLATPCDLEDFALGFALTEGIVEQADEVFDTLQRESEQGITLQLDIASRRFEGLKLRRRTLAGRTGCGLCGTDSLDQALRPVPRVVPPPRVDAAALSRAVREMRSRQPLFDATGSVHAAAFCDGLGQVLLVREDVGRHNALDKLVGAMARQGLQGRDGLLVVSSRASVEMVQKAAICGCGLLAAVSAPTSLAVRTAREAGMTLVGRLRGDDMVVYCGEVPATS
jgi:FdhD protein